MRRYPLVNGLVTTLLLSGYIGCSESTSSPTPVPSAPVIDAQVASASEDSSPSSRPTRATFITFDDLEFSLVEEGTFDPTQLPQEVQQLVGQPIRIRGYMLNSFQRSGIQEFVLIRDNQMCCFGPGAKLFHNMIVEMPSGATTGFTVRPITVEGWLTIDQLRGVEGELLSVFRLQGQPIP